MAQILSAGCGLLFALMWRLLPRVPSLVLRSLLAVTGAGAIFFLSSWIMFLPYRVAWGLNEDLIELAVLPASQLYLVGYLAWKWVGMIRSMTEAAIVHFTAVARMVALAAAPSLAMVAGFAVTSLSEPPGLFGSGYAILPLSGSLLIAGYYRLYRALSGAEQNESGAGP